MPIIARHWMTDDEGNRMQNTTYGGKIACGFALTCSKYASSVNTSGTDYFITTGNNPPRLAYDVTTSGNTLVKFHEGVSFNNEFDFTLVNANRTNTFFGSSLLYQDGNLTASGNVLKTTLIPQSSGKYESTDFVLASNTNYMVNIKSLSGSVYCGIKFKWTEFIQGESYYYLVDQDDNYIVTQTDDDEIITETQS